jgi:hypothetical protein
MRAHARMSVDIRNAICCAALPDGFVVITVKVPADGHPPAAASAPPNDMIDTPIGYAATSAAFVTDPEGRICIFVKSSAAANAWISAAPRANGSVPNG